MANLGPNISQRLTQSQTLALTPAMQLKLKLWQMNLQELSQTIERELEENPLLELVEGWNHLPSLEELERRYIQVLLKHESRKSRVAEILGKDRTTLYRKLRDLGLAEPGEEGPAGL